VTYNAVKLKYWTSGQDNHIQQQKTTIILLIFYYNYFSFCCDSPPPSNCNGVEYDQVPEVQGLEHINLKLSRQQA
jgi:hypothetical protein